MNRYALIEEKFPREFLLLQGTGCFHGNCAFCDYHLDVSGDPFAVNAPVLDLVTGRFGVLDVINSGSAHELDDATLRGIAEVCREKRIHTLWFEAHWAYHDRLDELRAGFPGVRVKFRTGIESFDHGFRRAMRKGIPDVSPQEIRAKIDGVCLLAGVQGQTQSMIRRDIAIAQDAFEYFSVNVFNENSTPVRRDEALIRWFAREIYPALQKTRNCEVLIENTDLGVG